jgi:hypothetical protein
VVHAGLEALELAANEVDLHGVQRAGRGVRAEEVGLATGVSDRMVKAGAPGKQAGDRSPVELGPGRGIGDVGDRVEAPPFRMWPQGAPA